MKRLLPIAAVIVCVLAAGPASAVPYTIDDFAIYSAGKVKLKDTVHGSVGSLNGDVQIKGGSTVHGDVAAGQGVKLSSGVVIDGIVAAGAEVKKAKSGVAVGNGTTAHGSHSSFSSLFGGGLPAVTSFGSGGSSYKSKGQTLTLAAGSYGSLSLKGSKGAGGLYLSAGDYYFDSLAIKGADIHVDLSGGAVNLYVTGGAKLDKLSVLASGQPAGQDAAALIYAEIHGKTKVGNADWLGTIYTPNDKLNVKNSSITGALLAGGDINVKGQGATIRYAKLGVLGSLQDDDPIGGGTGGTGGTGGAGAAHAPEPGTLALCLTGLAGLIARRRKRRRA